MNKNISSCIGVALSLLMAPFTSQAEEGESEGQQVYIAPPNVVEEVVVLGRFVPDEKRTTSEISNVLDEDALNILADTSVGDALSRVTGVSLVGGKFVYVRGLGERYSSSLLNGSRLSSPVPFQKTVPLDIVPKSIVSNLLVQKTYSAQYPGDFSGGVVDIRTRATPDENYLNIKLSVGGDDEVTFGEGLDYLGSDTDNFGFDDGTRDIPDNIRVLTSDEFNDLEFPESAAAGASFFNRWTVRERDIKPNYNGDIEAGVRFDFDNGMALGILAAGKYQNNYDNRLKDFARYEFTGVDGGFVQTVDYDEDSTTQTINASAFLNVGLEINNDNQLIFTHVLLRQTDNFVQQQRGLSSEDNVANGIGVENLRLQFIENEIRSTSLRGEHFFNLSENINGAKLAWRLVDGDASRDSPDSRTYTYADNAQGLQEVVTSFSQAEGDLEEVFQAPERQFQELEDELEEYGVDFELPLAAGNVILKFGVTDYERLRESEERLFRFDVATAAPDFVSLQTPSQLFSLDNFADEFIQVTDFSSAAANTSGIFPFAESGEEGTAYYLAIDAQITPRVRLQAGVRQEDVTQFADAFGGNTLPNTINDIEQDYNDTLPSASLTYEFIDNMQVRFAYSETVNRPSLLEITGSTILNPRDFNLYRGNVNLQQAELENFDLRWEYYFGLADSVSVGLFYKEFDNPIEVGLVQAANEIFTWFNGEEAELSGVEVELTKDLPFGDWFGGGDHWNYFTLSANATYVDSEVTLLGDGETAVDVPLTGDDQLGPLFENERALTGQSDLLANLILSYRNFDANVEASLAFNFTDDRIVLVGEDNQPNIVEKARTKLDFLFKYGFQLFGNEAKLELKIQNIFDDNIEWEQAGQLYERWDDGVRYSLGVSYDFR